MVRIEPTIRNGLKSPMAPTVTPMIIWVKARHKVATLDLDEARQRSKLLE